MSVGSVKVKVFERDVSAFGGSCEGDGGEDAFKKQKFMSDVINVWMSHFGAGRSALSLFRWGMGRLKHLIGQMSRARPPAGLFQEKQVRAY